jgi:hypothetical protein
MESALGAVEGRWRVEETGNEGQVGGSERAGRWDLEEEGEDGGALLKAFPFPRRPPLFRSRRLKPSFGRFECWVECSTASGRARLRSQTGDISGPGSSAAPLPPRRRRAESWLISHGRWPNVRPARTRRVRFGRVPGRCREAVQPELRGPTPTPRPRAAGAFQRSSTQ